MDMCGNWFSSVGYALFRSISHCVMQSEFRFYASHVKRHSYVVVTFLVPEK